MKNYLIIIFFLLFACQNQNNFKKNKKDNLNNMNISTEAVIKLK